MQDAALIDTDGDGIPDAIDYDGDGIADAPLPSAAALPAGFINPTVAGQIFQIDGKFYVAIYDDAIRALKWTPAAVVAPPTRRKGDKGKKVR